MALLAIPVISDAINSLEYDFPSSNLLVEFSSNQIYLYQSVPHNIYQLLLDANATQTSPQDSKVSVGSLFHYLIRIHSDSYHYRKLDQEELALVHENQAKE